MTKTAAATKQPELALNDQAKAKQELTVHQGKGRVTKMEPVPMSSEAALMAVIERAARDPTVDIDKFERLLKVADTIKERAAEAEFDDAMAVAQSEMQSIKADLRNTQTKSKYPSQKAIDSAIRTAYTKHGFSVRYDTETINPELVRVICICKHKGGHAIKPHIDIPSDGKGARGGDVMTKTHATISAVTYGRTALLKMVFNLAVESQKEDDDGNAAATQPITSEQLAELTALAGEINAIGAKLAAPIHFDIERFCTVMEVESISDISRAQFPRAVKELASFKRKLMKDSK